MSITNSQGWDRRDELTTQSPGDASGGSGGGLMPIWEETRSEKLNALATSSIENKSSFGIPNAVVGSVSNSWSRDHSDGEFLAGINVRGAFVDSSSRPLSGTATVSTSGGQQVGSKSTTGDFVLSLGLLLGVESGSDVPGEQYDFRWSPNASGLAFTKDNIPIKYSTGVVKYGLLEGTITDFNGDPVPNDVVAGPGGAAITDEDGDYNIIGPGGTTETFETLSGSLTDTVTLNADSKTVRDWQYPKLTIRVLDADYQPVGNAPVQIDDRTYYTNDSGKVELPQAPLKDYKVTVMGEFTAPALSVSQQGQEFVYTMGPADTFNDFPDQPGGIGGVTLTVLDSSTGRPIENMGCNEITSGTVASTDSDGKCRLLVVDTGQEVEVEVGVESQRYNATKITGELPKDTMLEVTVELDRRTNVVNT